jgi:ATP-dependent Clp protease ATP-binding subunit ClpX
MNNQLFNSPCNFCDRDSTKEILSELEPLSRKFVKVKLCDACYKSYMTGNKFGQVQIHQNLLSVILGAEDEAPVLSLKEKLAEVAPLSKRYLFSLNSTKVKNVNPKELYNALNKKVVGQEYAKKRISVTVFEHMRNVFNYNLNDKQNILFLGPSGSGKTLIVNTISNHLEVPFISSDATSLSPTGFQGADADTVITDLLIKANGEVSFAEKGVVFIDEIDKLASNNTGTRLESFHYSTQSTLLKLIEGKKVRVNPSALGDGSSPPIMVNTAKILFCFGGAFNGLEKIVAQKLGLTESMIGFRKSNDSEYDHQINNYEIYNKASHDILSESLIEFGLSAEFVGRIQSIVPLVPLSKEQMLYCLKELEDSPVRKSQILFAESNLELSFDDDFYDEVVDKAIKAGTGTRALNSIVKTSISNAAFDYLGQSNSDKKIIQITKDCVHKPEKYLVQ